MKDWHKERLPRDHWATTCLTYRINVTKCFLWNMIFSPIWLWLWSWSENVYIGTGIFVSEIIFSDTRMCIYIFQTITIVFAIKGTSLSAYLSNTQFKYKCMLYSKIMIMLSRFNTYIITFELRKTAFIYNATFTLCSRRPLQPLFTTT